MHRCQPDHADLMLDTWGWRFTRLAEAEAVYHKLAGYKGAHWPHWAATVRRLREEPAGAPVLPGQAGDRVRASALSLGWGEPPPQP